MAYKIESLSKEQEARFQEYIHKWTDIGLSTQKANRKEAEEGVLEMYKIAGLKKPKIVWCDSPLSQGIVRMIVMKMESDGLLKKGKKIGASVRDSVWDSVGDSVWASVGASVRDSVWASVWASVRASVWASVGDSVRDSVWASVGDSVGASVGDSGYGQHDANWLAFYDFFMEVCKLEQETNKLSGIWKVSKNAGWYLPHENICWVSERHNKLNRDDRGRLHNEHGMALQYPDGWGIYALHGVRFPEELYKKIILREMPMEEVLKITDIDQRVQAIKFAKTGLRDFYQQQGGKKVDEVDKLDSKLRKVHYELWKIPAGEIFNQEVAFATYDCPSSIERGEKQEYAKGVPVNFNKVAEAMAWGQSNDEHTMTAKQWLELVPLIHEA